MIEYIFFYLHKLLTKAAEIAKVLAETQVRKLITMNDLFIYSSSQRDE